jgi:very-short-patch-repair endonuclease
MTRSRTDKAEMFLYYWRISAPRSAPLPEEEYNFDHHLGRRHKFDFCWKRKKVAVEVNGQAWKVKGGGRHGKSDDLEKLNLATSLGWKVYQFTPEMLERDPASCVDMVVKALRLQEPK